MVEPPRKWRCRTNTQFLCNLSVIFLVTVSIVGPAVLGSCDGFWGHLPLHRINVRNLVRCLCPRHMSAQGRHHFHTVAQHERKKLTMSDRIQKAKSNMVFGLCFLKSVEAIGWCKKRPRSNTEGETKSFTHPRRGMNDGKVGSEQMYGFDPMGAVGPAGWEADGSQQQQQGPNDQAAKPPPRTGGLHARRGGLG